MKFNVMFLGWSLFFVCGVVMAGESALEDNGIEFGGGITSVYQRNVQGGLNTNDRDGEFSGSYDVEMTVDLEKFMGLKGKLFFHGEGGWTDSEGIDGSSVGSFSGVNADAGGNRSFDVVELFYSTELTEQLGLTVGKIDFSGFFDASAFANDEASQFLNGSLVNNASIPFPDYSLGVILSYALTENWYVMGGVADAQADGRESGFDTALHDEDYYFYIVETGFNASLNSDNGALEGVYRLGVWNDSQPKGNSDSSMMYRDDVGFYASFDQMIYKENNDSEDSQGAGVFFRYGYADLNRNDLEYFYSFGVQYQGLFDNRDNDVLGLGYANCGFSDYADSTYPDDNEDVFELYYSMELSDSVHLTPDIQYIADAGGAGSKDAIVAGLRLQIDF